MTPLRHLLTFALATALLLPGQADADELPPLPSPAAFEGTLDVYRAITPDGSDQLFVLTLDDGRTMRLEIGEDGEEGMESLAGGRVSVVGAERGPDTLSVERVVPLAQAGTTSAAVSGPQPMLLVLCRFKDKPDTYRPRQYFVDMIDEWPSGDQPGGLNHYWHTLSHGRINLSGRGVVGWYTLPHNYSHYVSVNGNAVTANITVLRDDCLGLADPEVNFTQFNLIYMVFNDWLGSAWYGESTLNYDGQLKRYKLAWIGYRQNEGYGGPSRLAHLMGYAFGLPNSSGRQPGGNNTISLNSQWDVMSDYRSLCNPPYNHSHPQYGCLGQHTIAHHMRLLGWIPPQAVYTVTPGARAVITLTNITQPAPPGTYSVIHIPLGAPNRFRTVEARMRRKYDKGLPGEGLIIHNVDTGNPIQHATVLDVDGNNNPNDDGAVWVPGETFVDRASRTMLTVVRATQNGFVVRIAPLRQQLFLPVLSTSPRFDQPGPDGYEPDNSPAQAKLIAHGQTQTRSIFPIGDRDWAKFTVSVHSGIVLETGGDNPTTDDTVITLYEADGITPIDDSDDIDPGRNLYSRIQRSCDRALSPGTYYVQVKRFANSAIITRYRLRLTVSPCQ